ncbi:MAG: FAD:protein FMN transferase [Bacillota bacterium]
MKLRKIIVIIMVIIITMTMIACSKSNEKRSKSKTDYKMGTVIKIKIHGSQAEELVEQSFTIIDEIEEKMSANLSNSEISKINQAAGQEKVRVSSETYQVLNKALDYAKMSQGFFDPSIGSLVELWGIGTAEEQVPSEEEIKEKIKVVDYKQVQLLEENHVFLTEKGMKLDVGGIAKGYAADRVISFLKSKGVQSAFIDIGGNVSVLGTKPNDDLWSVGIQNPNKNRGQVLAAIDVKDKTIVTSGNYERYFTKNGTKYHHILNPKTGYPARKNIISVTIVAEKSFDADALSTAVYALGLKEGLSLINSLDKIEAMVVTADNKVHITPALRDNTEILEKSTYKVIK